MGAVALVIFLLLAYSRRSRATLSPPRLLSVWAWRGVRFLLILTILGLIGVHGAAIVGLLAVMLFGPFVLLNAVLVPLGLPRAAFWAARCCWPLESSGEWTTAAAMYGALALARQPVRPGAREWLTQKLEKAGSPGGAGLVAAGLLAALRGDRPRACGLLSIADGFSGRLIARRTRTIARDWLIVDAARVGDWSEVIRLGKRGAASLRWSYAVARMAERLKRSPHAPWSALLVLYWLAAPRRLATLPLLRRALAVPRARLPAGEAVPAPRNLSEALGRLADVLSSGTRDPQIFAAAVGAVEATLAAPDVTARIERRLQALGATDAEAVLKGVRRRLVDLIAPMIEATPDLGCGVERGPLLEEAVGRVRQRLFRDIEAQCKDYSRRLAGETSLSPLAEWEAWGLLRSAAEHLLRLAPEMESTLFSIMFVSANNFAVFQQNKFKRRSLAHEIYSWLHRHAAGDPSALDLLQRNVRASRA